MSQPHPVLGIDGCLRGRNLTDWHRLRRSARHWTVLAQLLTALDRCAVACARLDACREDPNDPLFDRRQRAFEGRLQTLYGRIDREVDRSTVERLQTEHARTLAQEAKRRAA